MDLLKCSSSSSSYFARVFCLGDGFGKSIFCVLVKGPILRARVPE